MVRVALSSRRLAVARVAITVGMAVSAGWAAIAAAAGGPIWPLFGVACGVWFVALWPRLGASLAAGTTTLAAFLVVLATVFLSPVVPLSFEGVATILWSLAGAAGVTAFYRTRAAVPTILATRFGVALAAAAGAIAWLVTYALCFVVPGATTIDWALRNDAAPHFMYARGIVYAGGIRLSDMADDPVPLGHALFAVAMAPYDNEVARATLLHRDLHAFATTWIVLLALTCLLSGALAAMVAGRAKSGWRGTGALAALCGSALPVTWYFSGYPIEFGFVNAQLVFPILFASVMAALGAERRPALALASQTVAGTLILAVWSPLIFLPLTLAAVVAWRYRGRLRAVRGVSRVMLLASLAQLIAYSVVVEAPLFLTSRSSLGQVGGLAGFPKWMLPSFAIAVVWLARKAYPAPGSVERRGIIATAVVGTLGLGAVIGYAHNDFFGVWSYYPHKYAWFVAALLIVVGIGLVARWSKAVPSRRARGWLLGGMVFSITLLFGPLVVIPQDSFERFSAVPLPLMLNGSYYIQGDQVSDEILANTHDAGLYIRWRSGEKNEHVVNNWLIQLAGEGRPNHDKGQLFIMGALMTTDAHVCLVAELSAKPMHIVTGDPWLQASLNETCPEQHITVDYRPAPLEGSST